MKKKYRGFTLIELVVVIIVLGILAAYAVPKIVGMTTAARGAVVKGLKGTVQSASDMVHALSSASGITSGSMTMDSSTSKTVTVASGYAAATEEGIVSALNIGYVLKSNIGGSTDTSEIEFYVKVETNSVIIYPKGATNYSTCNVTYTYSGSTPTVTYSTTDCS